MFIVRKSIIAMFLSAFWFVITDRLRTPLLNCGRSTWWVDIYYIYVDNTSRSQLAMHTPAPASTRSASSNPSTWIPSPMALVRWSNSPFTMRKFDHLFIKEAQGRKLGQPRQIGLSNHNTFMRSREYTGEVVRSPWSGLHNSNSIIIPRVCHAPKTLNVWAPMEAHTITWTQNTWGSIQHRLQLLSEPK